VAQVPLRPGPDELLALGPTGLKARP